MYVWIDGWVGIWTLRAWMCLVDSYQDFFGGNLR